MSVSTSSIVLSFSFPSCFRPNVAECESIWAATRRVRAVITSYNWHWGPTAVTLRGFFVQYEGCVHSLDHLIQAFDRLTLNCCVRLKYLSSLKFVWVLLLPAFEHLSDVDLVTLTLWTFTCVSYHIRYHIPRHVLSHRQNSATKSEKIRLSVCQLWCRLLLHHNCTRLRIINVSYMIRYDISDSRLGSLANPFPHRPFPFLPDWFHELSDYLMFLFCSTAGFVWWYVRLSWLLVGFQTHFKSMHFRSFVHPSIHSFIHSFSKPVRQQSYSPRHWRTLAYCTVESVVFFSLSVNARLPLSHFGTRQWHWISSDSSISFGL